MAFLRVTGAQIDLTVGDLTGNRERILDAMAWAEGVQADVLVLPELAVTGYPPEDLVLREGFIDANLRVVADLAKSAEDVVTVVGFVDRAQPRSDDSFERPIANAAALLHRGELRGVYHKVALPNFGVFDEDRYFTAGVDDAGLWSMGSVSVGVSVCEDIWLPEGPPLKQATAGAGLLLNINGSPYHRGKGEEREALLSRRARQASTPLVYLNLVGAQDELVFDGQSMVFDASGELLYRAPQFTEQRFWVDVPVSPRRSVGATPVARSGLLEGWAEAPPPSAEPLGDTEELYRALEAGLRGYVAKNGFTEVVVGLSGGIDSTIITGLMQQVSNEPVKTYSIGFPVAGYDETAYAREAADFLGAEHHELIVEPDSIGLLPKLVWHYDEPFGDSSAIPTYYVSQLSRRDVTVAVTGDAGDELFFGYPRYQAVKLAGHIDRLPKPLR
ncbi:MAG: asparagine synthase-related protein, partial [Acidimicrobiia bacterium]